MAKHFEGYKATQAEIIAQHWFFSCDAPDTNETAAEIQRLAKMIDTVLAGGEIPWRVVNRSLNAAQQNAHLTGLHCSACMCRNEEIVTCARCGTVKSAPQVA